MNRRWLAGLLAWAALGPAGAHEGEQVTVRGQRPAATAGTTEVGPATFAQAAPRTAEDLLRLAPGVAVSRHAGEGKGVQLFLRGFDAGHGSDVEVCLEGVPLNEPGNVHGHGYVDLGLLVPEAVGGLQVRKGPFGLDQGDFATAGSLNLRLGAPEGARVGAQVGSTQRSRLHGVLAGPAGLLATEALVDQGFGSNRAAQRAALTGRLRLGSRGALLLAAGAGGFGTPGAVRREDVAAGRISPYGAYREDTDGASRQALVAAVGQGQLGAVGLMGRAWLRGRSLRLDEDFTGFAADPVGGDGRRQRDGRLEAGARGDVTVGGGAFGLRLHGHSRHTHSHVEETARPRGAPPTPRRDQSQIITSAGLGVEGEALLGALELAVGLRGDLWHGAVRDGLSGAAASALAAALAPRARLSWRPLPGFGVFAAWGRGLRPPEPAAALADPAPVRADHAELGARWRRGALGLGLAGFAVDIPREALYDHPTGRVVEQGATRRLGAELDARFSHGPWRLDGDLLLARAQFTRTGDPVPNAPRLRIAGGGRFAGPEGLRAGLRAELIGARPLALGARTGSLLRLDAHLGWRLAPFELRLDVENLLDRADPDFEAQFPSRWDLSRPADPLPAVHSFALPPLAARLTLTVEL